MPSPVGHALGGAIAGLVCGRGPAGAATVGRRALQLLTSPLVVASAVAGCLPDLDFLWGRHSMETHSLGAAVLAGLLAWLWRGGRIGWRGALAIAVAWASHVVFDWLGSDDTPPLGVMALWPATSSFYFAHAYVFEAISRRYWLTGFWAHNLWAVTTEVLILGPVLAVAAWRRAQVPPDPGAETRRRG